MDATSVASRGRRGERAAARNRSLRCRQSPGAPRGAASREAPDKGPLGKPLYRKSSFKGPLESWPAEDGALDQETIEGCTDKGCIDKGSLDGPLGGRKPYGTPQEQPCVRATDKEPMYKPLGVSARKEAVSPSAEGPGGARGKGPLYRPQSGGKEGVPTGAEGALGARDKGGLHKPLYKPLGASKEAVSPHAAATPDPLSPQSPDCALSQSSSFNLSALSHSSSLTLSASSSSSHSFTQASLLTLRLPHSHPHSRSSSRAPGGSISQPSSLNFSSLQRGLSRQSEGAAPSPPDPSDSLCAQSSTRSHPSPSPRVSRARELLRHTPGPRTSLDTPEPSSGPTALGDTVAGVPKALRRASSTSKVGPSSGSTHAGPGTGVEHRNSRERGAEDGGCTGGGEEEDGGAAVQAGRGGSGRLGGPRSWRPGTAGSTRVGERRASLRQRIGSARPNPLGPLGRSRSQGTGAGPLRLFSLSQGRQGRGQEEEGGRRELDEARKGARGGGKSVQPGQPRQGKGQGKGQGQGLGKGQDAEPERDIRTLFRLLTSTSGAPLVHRMFPGIKPHVVRPMPPEAQRQELRFGEEYAVGRVLGEGAYGVVRSCIHLKSGRSLAVKIVAKAKLPRARDLARARLEPKIQRRLMGHRNVLQFEDSFEDAKSLYLVTERCTGGDLFELLSRVSRLEEHHAAAMFAQLLAAVGHCRKQDVVHRDIKLENILVADKAWKRSREGADPGGQSGSSKQVFLGAVPTLKLADFGSAVVVPRGEKASGRSGGSLMYQAPEVLWGKKYDGAVDMWSLGVVLFALLSGSFPFTAPSDSLLVGMIKRGVFHMAGPAWQSVSVGAKEVVAALLQPDPEARAQPGELWAHPWLAPHAEPAVHRIGLAKSWTLTAH